MPIPMGREKIIHLKRIIAWCAFNKVPIEFEICKTSFKFTALVEMLEDDEFSISMPDEQIYRLMQTHAQNIYEVRIPYRHKLIQFKTNWLADAPPNEDHKCFFRLPFSGAVINQRKETRWAFRKPLSAVIKDNSKHPQIIAEKLVDFASHSLALEAKTNVGIQRNVDDENLVVRLGRQSLLDTSAKLIKVFKLDNGNRRFVFELPEPKQQQLEGACEPFSVHGKANVVVKCAHPLVEDLNIHGMLHDITPSGFSMLLQRQDIAIPIGMLLQEVSLYFPGFESLQCAATVYAVSELAQDDQMCLLVSCNLVGATPKDLNLINTYIQSLYDKRLSDLNINDLENFFLFLFESNFIYNGKRKQIQKFSPQITHTYKALASKQNAVSRQLVFKDRNQILGHGAFIHYLNNTWLAQHVCVVSSKHRDVIPTLYGSMLNCFSDASANKSARYKYVMSYHRPESKFLSSLYAYVQSEINQKDIFDIVPYRYCCLSGENGKVKAGLNVQLANTADDAQLKSIYRHCLKSHSFFEADFSDGLDIKRSLSNAYRQIGLYRYRKVLVCRFNETGVLGFAICDFSSPGLNFSELSNSFRIFVSEQVAYYPATKAQVFEALAQEAISLYQSTQMPACNLLLFNGQQVPKQFEAVKDYHVSLLNLKGINVFKKHFFEGYRNFRSVRKKSALAG